MPASELWFVVPGDPGQNTGGYRYVRRLVSALAKAGIPVQLTGLEGTFPQPDDIARQSLDRFLAGLPDGTRVVLDGLAMGGLPEVLQRHQRRLNLMALVHHPLADENGLSEQEQAWFKHSETTALACVGAVFTTSYYTAERLLAFGVTPARVTTALPAVDDAFFQQAPLINRRDATRAIHLLCVGHLSPRKAQHQLIQALAQLTQLNWRLTLVGSAERATDYASGVRALVRESGLESRVEFAGELEEADVLTAYQQADLFVFPSLYEGYGMVIDEALAAGLPVLSSNGGALVSTGAKPGVALYEAGNVAALATKLTRLLAEPDALETLVAGAMQARCEIRRWSETAQDFLSGLEKGRPRNPVQFAADWLEAREPADHQARDAGLTARLAEWLTERYDCRASGSEPGAPLHFVDLGTGRGSNPVYLCPRLPVPQRWTLVEPDQTLAGIALQRVEKLDAPAVLETMVLTKDNLSTALPENADLVTSSALIDLVSEPWLSALSAAVAKRQAALLVVITYSGFFALEPAHPFDDELRALVNAHQHREKGSGAALGPDATPCLSRLMSGKGYEIQTADSPWVLTGEQANLAAMLLEGWAEAATEQQPEQANAIQSWLETRRQQLDADALAITVSHSDLLAWPKQA